MYRCEICHSVSQAGEQLKKHILYRTVRCNVQKQIKEDYRKDLRLHSHAPPNGGLSLVVERKEISKEIPVCKGCWDYLQAGVPFPIVASERKLKSLPSNLGTVSLPNNLGTAKTILVVRPTLQPIVKPIHFGGRRTAKESAEKMGRLFPHLAQNMVQCKKEKETKENKPNKAKSREEEPLICDLCGIVVSIQEAFVRPNVVLCSNCHKR